MPGLSSLSGSIAPGIQGASGLGPGLGVLALKREEVRCGSLHFSGTQAEEVTEEAGLTSRNLTQSKEDGHKMPVEMPGSRSVSVTLWAQVRSQLFLAKVASICLVGQRL